MVDNWTPEEELVRLESIHDRVAKLRTRLKDLQQGTYDLLGANQTDRALAEAAEDGVSQEFR